MNGVVNSSGKVVGGDDLRKAKNKFKWFFSIFLVLLVSLIGFHIYQPNCHFLFNLGSLLTFASVLHIRFFDIEKNSFIQKHAEVSKAHIGKPLLCVEKLMSFAWVFGAILLFLNNYF